MPPTFSALNLPKSLVSALARQEITQPTPVQMAVIPDAVAGHHVLGRARTGSGKTLSFGLPVLARLAGAKSRPKAPRGLILLPTRELASQVRNAIEPLAQRMGLRVTTVYGGVPINKQINALRGEIDVMIATPGRLTDLLDRRTVFLDDIEITVLDEADHLCDLGFYKPIDALLAKTPQSSQRLLLSATLDGDVNRLVKRHLPIHKLHEIDSADEIPADMEHHLFVTEPTDRARVTRDLVMANPRSIVFTRTRRGASRLARQLSTGDVVAVDLHGDLNQSQRERNLRKFANGTATVIVATDVAARGIHIDGIGLVVHYDAPAEPKAFTHRSGRTARAGESGAVVTLTTPADLDAVAKMQRKAGVTPRRHDARRLPEVLTREALATSGSIVEVEVGGRSSRRPSGNRSGQPSRNRSSSNRRRRTTSRPTR